MIIKVAKTIGFCRGVKRALDLTNEVLSSAKCSVYSLGQIIHNQGVVNELTQSGLKVVTNIKDAKDNSIIIFPSHGIPEEAKKEAKRRKLQIIDTTCPYVNKVHRIARSLKNQNYQIIIFGDRNHPEVRAIKSLAPKAIVVDKNIKLRDNKKLDFAIISQTTQAKDSYFNFIHQFFLQNPFVKEVKVFNTICADALSRQRETLCLCKKVNLMLIIGGKNSANTKRLKALCELSNVKSIHLERIDELKKYIKKLKNIKSLGITTGASTPRYLARDLVKFLKIEVSK